MRQCFFAVRQQIFLDIADMNPGTVFNEGFGESIPDA
jgi:hypothetical protein